MKKLFFLLICVVTLSSCTQPTKKYQYDIVYNDSLTKTAVYDEVMLVNKGVFVNTNWVVINNAEFINSATLVNVYDQTVPDSDATSKFNSLFAGVVIGLGILVFALFTAAFLNL